MKTILLALMLFAPTARAQFGPMAVFNPPTNAGVVTNSTIAVIQNGASPNVFPNAPIVQTGNINSYFQNVIQNLSHGANASAVYVITGPLGSNTSWYTELGMNSDKYASSNFPVEVSSASFLASSDGPLILQAGILGGGNGAAAARQYIVMVTSTSLIQAMITQSSVTILSPTGLKVNYGVTAGTVTVGTGVTFSSAPVFQVTAAVSTATLATGDTVYSFIPDSAITLTRLIVRNLGVGVGGGGDALSCNNSGAIVSTMSVTMAAAAAKGTEVASPSPQSNVAAGTEIFCHYDGSSNPKPSFYFNLEYQLQ